MHYFVPYTTYNNNEQCKPSGIKLSFFVVHFERKVPHASAMRKHRERLSLVPGCSVGCDFETTRVTDEFIQDADNLFKFRPVVSLLLPTVQHQLVESGRAVHGRGKAIALINSFYYLHGQNKHLGQDGGSPVSKMDEFETQCYSHPDWTFPSMVVLHTTSLPKGQYHNSRHHWLM